MNISPKELDVIKGKLSEKPASDKQNKGNSRSIFLAIKRLINDQSNTSTLNNAVSFSDIDYKNLIEFANLLVAHRKDVLNEINSNLVQIVRDHKNVLAMSLKKDPLLAGTKDKKNEKAILSNKTFKTKAGLNSNALDTVINTGQTDLLTSLSWAEQNHSKQLNDLHKIIQPYLNQTSIKNAITSKANTVENFVKNPEPYLNVHSYIAAIEGFNRRMQIEPIGNLHLERIEMYPAGIERGELVHSVPLAPSETVNISHKEWSVSEKQFEEIVDDYFEGYSETGVAEKNDIAMSSESQTKHATALNIGASLSASYSTVTLSTNLSSNFGYNSTSDDQQSKKDSRNHSMELTKKASSRTKKDHKVTFKVTSIAGSEDQSVRVITNPSDTDAMRIDYFQLARKWRVDLLRYGLRMTYDIVIPNPGSGIISKVQRIVTLEKYINQPFTFLLSLDEITVNNYDILSVQYYANVPAPPEAEKWVNVHKDIQGGDDNFYNNAQFDSIEFEIDENYYIDKISGTVQVAEDNQGDARSIFNIVPQKKLTLNIYDDLTNNNDDYSVYLKKSGRLSLNFFFEYIRKYIVSIDFHCVPKDETIKNWKLEVWNALRQGAEDQYNKTIQNYKDERTQLINEINSYDALTLRRMEQEEIMRGVLQWLFGPQFQFVPSDISVSLGLDIGLLSNTEWLNIMEHGEIIKYIHNAIEWENVLYFTYPYFWDNNSAWEFKKFLYHPDPTHRTFLRAGAARVVLTVRPGFELSFTQLIETGAFNALPASHPYVTIAQEIQNFANTNYPGFPPANPEQDYRPLLYLEQRLVWKEMQYIIQLLNAFKVDPANNGLYPTTAQGLNVLAPYLDEINANNEDTNTQQLNLDPNTPMEALLPTYAVVPVNDFWGNKYFYQCPGITGDYDLISYGANGHKGGHDKNADISANCEASLISTWYEYTPTNALDIAVTMNQVGVMPPPIDSNIA